ncbi:hypothetical protein [Streptacidiphilus sp. EB103A]|uniref:hypothetical protein n=1 Tax=Streptacidiphilus sp. EB103A TaxID=3156275 RepID=UPI003512FECC
MATTASAADAAAVPGRREITAADGHYTLTTDPDGTVRLTASTPDGELRSELTGTADPADLAVFAAFSLLMASASIPAQRAGQSSSDDRRVGDLWTEEEQRTLRDRARAGATAEDLALELGRSLNAVHWRLFHLGLGPRPQGPEPDRRPAPAQKETAYTWGERRQDHPQAYARWTPQDDERLRAMAAAGATMPELMAAFGRQEGGIAGRLRKIGATGPVVDQINADQPPQHPA